MQINKVLPAFLLLFVMTVLVYSQDSKVIRATSGFCGHYNYGEKHFIINTDAKNKYKVTVRTTWAGPGERGEKNYVYTINAGATLYLGCSLSDAPPLINYQRYITSESIIKKSQKKRLAAGFEKYLEVYKIKEPFILMARRTNQWT